MTNDATLRIALIGASGWLGRSIGPSILKKGIVTP
jgi:putative NADH-flavin reductase